MPEGHTLHRLAQSINEHFAGQVVEVSSPQGRFVESANLVDGTGLVDAQAWGKHLFIGFEAHRWIHVHLGLYGTFDVHTGPPAPSVGQVRLRLVSPSRKGPDGAALTVSSTSYADLRGATTCDMITDSQRAAVIARLGPDPLRADSDPDRVWARISRSRAPIGALLMDQTVLAGVGNVYRAELLFRHRLHPLRPGSTLRRGQVGAMWQDLVELMRAGVSTGRVDTVREEHTPEAMGREPRRDDHGGEVYVYRRLGQPCHVCGSKVRTEVLAGRNLFWCPKCQPKFRSRAAAQ
ncbi:MAG TPA: DNA-formamidopyrimidine glycosylase family protein [Nocardioidaceae bacterium]|nr:DNA-formamidopyrimidine glycosylase family protein [Nocardioidaceae bacterium]